MGEVQVYHSVAAFTSDVYGQVIDTQTSGPLQNVFLSPLSMYIALLMTLLGTGTDTRRELQDAIQLPRTLQDSEIMNTGSSLLSDISKSTDVRVLVANRLFLLNGIRLNPEFQSILTKHFSAELEMLTLYPYLESKRRRINKWVFDQTRGLIRGLIPKGALDHKSALSIVNALYFKGLWRHPFDKRHTRLDTFYTGDGRVIPVQMMYVNQKFEYLEMDELEADALKLPFGDGSEWDMLIILPYKKRGLRKVLSHLRKRGQLSSILSKNFQSATLQLYMPRFRIGLSESSVNMKKILMDLGARLLFSEMADLSGMSYYDFLSVSGVFHKAVLEVNEDGATAAAATSVNVFSRSAGPELRVDRPFFVAIVHKRAGPVFLGHVVRPETI